MVDLVLNIGKQMEERAQQLGVELELIFEPKDFSGGAPKERGRLLRGHRSVGGLLIRASKPKDVVSVRRFAKKAKFVIADSNDEQTVRFIMEQKWIHFFTDIETSTGRDHTHYRRSNFNQVLAKLAKETRKTYLVDFSNLLKVQGRKRSLLIGRIMQNIKICDKYKVPVSIATFATNKYDLRNPNDLKALLRVLRTKKIADIERLLEGL
jgi:RNase P/RNase MRP subunit p30